MYTNLYDDPLNIGAIFSMMILWTVIYIPLAWYIERIFPGEYGAPLPLYFPFLVCVFLILFIIIKCFELIKHDILA
jgi:hypothetical protein